MDCHLTRLMESTLPTYDEIMRTVRATTPEALVENSKFKAKLTFNARCSALAALKAGYVVPVVAHAFGVNRSTIRFIINPASPHYRNVRKQYFEFGKERFIEEYLTPDVIEMLDAAAKSPEVLKSGNQQRAEKSVDTTAANPKATSRAGRHTLFYHSGTLFVEVKWYDSVEPDVDGPREPGWYVYVDPNSPAWEEGGWEHGGVNPPTPSSERFTSKTAFDYFVQAVDAEVVENAQA